MTDTTTPATVSEQAMAGVTEGKRVRRTFAPKDLMPNKAWLSANVLTNKGQEQTVGALITIGRLYGSVTGTAAKINEFEGKQLESIVLTGVFGSESYVTGEVTEGMTKAYPPMMYCELIRSAMTSDPTLLSVEIDCDIGLQYTGKSIPYEWVVIAYREGKEMDALKRIRSGRARPANAGVLQIAALANVRQVGEGGTIARAELEAPAVDGQGGEVIEGETAGGDADKGAKSSKK